MAGWFAKPEDAVASDEQGTAVVEEGEAEETSIAMLSEAHRAIAEARSLDELKGIRDKAEAARKYAHAAGMGLEILNYAAELKLRAERRAGAMLAKLKLHGGDRSEASADERLTLEDIGISKDQSSRWQLSAVVSDKRFERYLSETQSAKEEVTTAGLMKIAREIRAKERQRKQEKANDSSNQPSDCEVVTDLNDLLTAERSFGCIYVDAPWPGAEVNERFAEVLGELPVEQLAGAQCHLHLWASTESLWIAKALLERWGFRFESLLVAVSSQSKSRPFWSDAHEFVVLGTRGETDFGDANPPSWLRAEREESGRASERVRRLVQRVSPGPYLELFGREEVSNWTIYQPDSPNEEPSDVIDAEATSV